MQRIDGPTRSATLPAPGATGAGGSSPGYFSNGDPIAGTPATTVSADWFNMVQEEIVGVVLGAGLTLDKNDRGQLYDAIQQIVADAVDQAELAPTFVPGVNGYRVAADGYIEQWGYVPGPITGEGQQTVTFPIAFPNGCFGIKGWIVNSSSTTTGSTQVQEVSFSLSQGTLMMQNHQGGTIVDAAGGFRWEAKGH